MNLYSSTNEHAKIDDVSSKILLVWVLKLVNKFILNKGEQP